MITRATLALCAALLAFFCYAYTPISDSDFWWHAASGRWILEHHTLPDNDPFGVFPNADVVRNNTVLHGQWLGQVVMAMLYDTGATHGMIGFRALLLTACVALLYWRARRLGATRWVTWAVLLPAAWVALNFTGDRPQLFSYLFATLTWLIVEHYERDHRPRVLWLLPLIAALWANMHGGVLLAVALLWLYVCASWLDAHFVQRIPNMKLPALAWASVAFSAATLLTPNGLTTYTYLFQLEGSALQQATSEYLNLYELFRLGYAWPLAGAVAYYALAVLAAAGLFRDSRPRLIIVLFLALIGFWHYRYLAFFIFIAAPLLCAGLASTRAISLPAARYERSGTYLVMGIALFAIVTGVVNGKALRGGVDRELFPVAALEHVGVNTISGKVFNHMQWGGYLLAQLPQQAQLFIDGRMLDAARLEPYTHVLWATPSGQSYFLQANFSWVMLPPHNRFTGERYALGDWLRQQAEWVLLYQDNHGLIYRRLTAANRRG